VRGRVVDATDINHEVALGELRRVARAHNGVGRERRQQRQQCNGHRLVAVEGPVVGANGRLGVAFVKNKKTRKSMGKKYF
jgi:hypothetical protein